MGKRSGGGGGGGVALDAVDSLINENQSIISMIQGFNESYDNNKNNQALNDAYKVINDNYTKLKDFESSIYKIANMEGQFRIESKLAAKATDFIKGKQTGDINYFYDKVSSVSTGLLKRNGYNKNDTEVSFSDNYIRLSGNKSYENRNVLKANGYKFKNNYWVKGFGTAKDLISEVKSLLE